jgi:hypothetical protein
MTGTSANSPKNRQSLAQIIDGIIQAGWRFISGIFSFNRSGSWVRLIFFAILLSLFFISVSPFSSWVSQLWQAFSESTFPGFLQTVSELWRRLREGTSASPAAVESGLALPQPDWRTRLELMWTSQGFSTLMQSILISFIPFLFSFWVAAYYFQYLNQIPSYRASLAHILQMIFPVRRRQVKIREGFVQHKGEQIALRRVGGPAWVSLAEENSAAFEKSNGTAHILLPKKKIASIDNYETLRSVLDLREENLVLNVSDRTRDGMRLQARQVHFVYRLQAGLPDVGLTDEQRQAAHQAFIYQHWLGNDWEKPEKRRTAVKDIISTELRHYIAQHELGDFFGAISAQADALPAGYQALNPFNAFAEEFSQKTIHAFEHNPGLKVTWTGKGEWVLLNQIQIADHIQAWADWLTTRLYRTSSSQVSLGTQSRTEEKNHQAQALLDTYHQLKNTDPTKWMKGVAKTYLAQLEEAQQSNLFEEQQDRDDLELVIRQLRRLT